MEKYKLKEFYVDNVELKCLLVSRGVMVDKAVYKYAKDKFRLNINPLCCNCMLLSDGTIVQLTDTKFHLEYLSGILSWNTLKLLRHVKDLATPFTLRLVENQFVLFYENQEVDTVTFPPASQFYKQKTALGRPYVGNTVLQGLDWVAFQCLWPCEFATEQHACQFCFSGGDFETLAKKGKALPASVPSADVKEITKYALAHDNVSSVQITGGSTHDGIAENKYITAYLQSLSELEIPGEKLLYITPPVDTAIIDSYFNLGATRIACSLELWDINRAKEVTPGKIHFIGRDRYLKILEYIAQKYGTGNASSNFIIGIEDFETLAEGATWMAKRSILPAASIWMPMGRPVQGSMKAPNIDYYKRVKEHFAELYNKYKLEPPKGHGLNVCIGRDIWNYISQQ